jgi:hypothetical protein
MGVRDVLACDRPQRYQFHAAGGCRHSEFIGRILLHEKGDQEMFKNCADYQDKAVLVHAFIQRHLAGGADNYAIALLLEKAGYTFRDLADALIAGRGM